MASILTAAPAPAASRARGARMRRFGRNDDGGVLIEMAIVLPLLLAVMGGIVDFGRLFQRQEVITNAAREGARIGALPGYGEADIQARVNAYLDDGLFNGAASNATVQREIITITPGAGPSFSAVRVTVTYTDSYLILGPLVGLIGGNAADFGNVTLTAISTMRTELAAGG